MSFEQRFLNNEGDQILDLPYGSQENVLYQGDCLDILSALNDNEFDLIIADPPYNIGILQKWSKEEYLEWCKKWLFQLKRVLREDGSLYVFVSRQLYPELYLMIRDEIKLYDRRILIYHYKNGGIIRNTSWRSSYEPILYFTKSDNYAFNVEKWSEKYFDVHVVARPQVNFKDKRLHPTQKPYELIHRLVKTSSDEHDCVLDCFSGSGTTLKVANDFNRACVSIEINPEYCDIIQERCSVFKVVYDTSKQKEKESQDKHRKRS